MRDFNIPIYPEDIKSLKINEQKDLADDIRKFLIENISKTGGHLSSNLGIIELTIALHMVYNSPKDKLIFDVGHQVYPHKILTGRSPYFNTLRQTDGLSGFAKYEESPHDVWEAGHSSTSLSAAAGFLEAKKTNPEIGEVIVIIGDASIQNGLAFSALNYLGALKDQKVTIILNDNNMSISKNVGSLSKAFDKIRIKQPYNTIKKITPDFIRKLTYKLKNSIRSYIYGPNLFHSYGFKYFGPIDGHDIKELSKYLNYAKKSNHSNIIHIKTIKGKGYSWAEEDKLGLWHGVSPFDIASGNSKSTSDKEMISWSELISDIILKFALENETIKVLCPAMISGSGWLGFQKKLPQQVIDVGIAEEHSVVMAAAMARNNTIPIVSIYSTFLQRTYDQLNHDVCRSNNKVFFLIDRAGIVGGDGDTHQGVFDIAILSHMPNMTIIMAKDAKEAYQLIDYAININDGPIALRYPKANIERLKDVPIEKITKPSWDIINSINDINIISYGPVINDLEKHIKSNDLDYGLINARFIKPVDLEVLKSLDNKVVYVYEEVIKSGSLGTLILEEVNNIGLNIDIKIIAINDQYVQQGDPRELKKQLGLDIDSLFKKIQE